MSKVNFLSIGSIDPLSPESLGTRLGIGAILSISTATDTANPVANKAYYIPFSVYGHLMISNIYWLNGATTISGNIDAGIYTATKTKVATIGSTAQSGTNALQSATLSCELGAGLYFLAWVMDNTTGTISAFSSGNAAYLDVIGCYQQTTAFTLPATATFAAPSSDFIPLVGINASTVV